MGNASAQLDIGGAALASGFTRESEPGESDPLREAARRRAVQLANDPGSLVCAEAEPRVADEFAHAAYRIATRFRAPPKLRDGSPSAGRWGLLRVDFHIAD